MTTYVLDKHKMQKYCFPWREIRQYWHVNGKNPHLPVKFACKIPQFTGGQNF
jgi:hypothetical protein